jgi:hypothetical protein
MPNPHVKIQSQFGVKRRVSRAWDVITDQFLEKGYRTDSRLHRTILLECRAFTRSTEVGVSPQAQRLIEILLDSVMFDPDPHWDVTREDLQKTVWGFADRLQEILGNISKSQKTQYITTFDVLHWLIPQIASILPFPKPP